MKAFFLFISFQESILIVLIALLLFGPKKIPEVARILGRGIYYLRNAANYIKQEIWEASENNLSKLNEPVDQIKDKVKETAKELKDDFYGPIKRDK